MTDTLSTNHRPPTFDHLRSAKKPVYATHQVVLDAEAAQALEEARQERDRLKFRAEAEKRREDSGGEATSETAAQLAEAEARFAEAEEAARDAVVEMKFRSIGRKPWARLIDAHPPSEEQRKKQKRWNEDTFYIAAIAACSLEPKLTEEEVAELWDSEEWTQAELTEMAGLCILINEQRRVVDLGKGSALI